MADHSIKCPLCHGTHPAGTTYCDVVWASIPEPDTDDATPPPPPSPPPPTPPPPVNPCPNCGEPDPGAPCWQCGADRAVAGGQACAVPGGSGQGGSGQDGVGSILLGLPNGAWVQLVPNRPVLLGRASENPQIKAGFPEVVNGVKSPVSRKHCYVTCQPGGAIEVVDADSTNGTFVPVSPVNSANSASCPIEWRLLAPGEKAVLMLPTQLRLGEVTLVTLKGIDPASGSQ